MNQREGPLPTVAAFLAGVVTLIWGVSDASWFLVAVAIFILVVSAQYYFRFARHLPWRRSDAVASGDTNHTS